MAQIIKHRRGSLESVSSATKRAGELLVVTGSAGITATNGGSILFVGIDGSTVTPANKILQGTTVPNLTGGSYDTSIDGIPFYDTDDNKLYILNKGGNVEIKTTANTGGTGIVSGSAQIVLNDADKTGFDTDDITEGTKLFFTDGRVKTKLNFENVVSSSAQITISSTTGFTDYSSSVATLVSASVAAGAPTFANIVGKPAGLVSGSSQIVLNDADKTGFDTTDVAEGTNLYYTDARVKTKLNADAVVSGSLLGLLPAGTVSGSSQVDADSITNFDTNVKAKLDADGVISGSAGIVPLLPTGTVSGSSQITYASISSIPTGIVSGSSQIVDILGALNTFSASASSSLGDIQNYTSSLRTAFTASGANVTFSGNVTIPGNFTVAGTQTIVDSTTVQIGDNIIELNGSAAANGGLYVKDATAPNTATGSLIWDTTNDYWKAGVKDSEIKILLAGGDSVVSGSAQITISSTTGFTDYSSSVATLVSSSVAAGAPTFANIVGKPAGLVSGSSQIVLNDADKTGFDTTDVAEGTNLYYTDARVKTKLNADAVVSGSLLGLLPAGTVSGSSQVDADSITNFDTNVKAKLDADGVISGSAGIVPLLPTGTVSGSSQITYASISSIPTGIVSGSSQIVDILGALNTFSASASSSLGDIQNYTSSLRTAFTASGANVTFSGNVTIPGNFTVAGTQTIVDSTTVQIGDNIIELNGSAAANGGLYVKDATAPNTATGSLIWDTTNDYWKAGVKDSEIKIALMGGDNLVTASAQILFDQINGYSTYSSSVATSISASVAAGAPTFANIVGKPAGLVSGSSQIVLNNADFTGFDTTDITEGTNLYYTDARVKTKLNADAVVSGSLLGLLPAGTVSGSSQIAYADISSIPAGIVSGSSQVTALLPTGVISGSAQTVAALASQNVSLGIISGSTLNITGNANIDGNLVLGGTITIGDNPTDNLVVNADLSSSIIPNNDNSFDLGSDTKRYKDIYGVNIYGAVKATNGVISGSSQLDSTTINLATLTNVSASGSFSGSFTGDGSALTGIASTLAFSGSTGNDTLNLKTEALLVTGSNSISAAVSNNTITITADNASTSAKGVASFSATNFGVTSGNVTIKAGGVTAATLNADLAGTGLSLDGVDNSLKVDYGSTSGTAVEGNTSLTVQGTANEIEITGGSVTLGSGGTVTIGLPDNVTISGSLTANGNVFLGNSSADSVTIAGNLFVQGTTTTVDSTTVQIGDNIIELNGSGAANGGLLVRDVTGGSTTSGSLLWDTTNDYWKAGAAGSEKEVARFSSSPTTSGSVQVIGANGLFVNSQISDDAVKVTIGTDLVITGLTANSFVVSNGSKKLISVTPSNAGDLIQWNGSSFVASNELDGGTF